MFLGGIGPTELIIILVIILIIFGVGKLPEVGRGLGKGIKEFKDASNNENALEAKEEPKEEAQEEKSDQA